MSAAVTASNVSTMSPHRKSINGVGFQTPTKSTLKITSTAHTSAHTSRTLEGCTSSNYLEKWWTPGTSLRTYGTVASHASTGITKRKKKETGHSPLLAARMEAALPVVNKAPDKEMDCLSQLMAGLSLRPNDIIMKEAYLPPTRAVKHSINIAASMICTSGWDTTETDAVSAVLTGVVMGIGRLAGRVPASPGLPIGGGPKLRFPHLPLQSAGISGSRSRGNQPQVLKAKLNGGVRRRDKGPCGTHSSGGP